jgi:hypothetical protein
MSRSNVHKKHRRNAVNVIHNSGDKLHRHIRALSQSHRLTDARLNAMLRKMPIDILESDEKTLREYLWKKTHTNNTLFLQHPVTKVVRQIHIHSNHQDEDFS